MLMPRMDSVCDPGRRGPGLVFCLGGSACHAYMHPRTDTPEVVPQKSTGDAGWPPFGPEEWDNS
jgi:hypothetical protein